MEVKKPHEEHLPVWAWLSILILAAVITGCMLWTFLDLNETETPIVAQNTSKSTKIAVDDWKTYENKDLGFSFKYPKDWTVGSSEKNQVWLKDAIYSKFTLENNPGEMPTNIDIVRYDSLSSITENKVYDSLLSYAKSLNSDCGKPATSSIYCPNEYKFLSLNAYKTVDESNFGKSAIVFEKDGKIIKINYNSENNIESTILSTFKLIDSEISTFQVYTNSTYGFSLNFPKGWEGYKMKEANIDGATATYYVELPTKLPASPEGDSTSDKGYFSPFAISVYTLDQWDAAQKADGPKDTLIVKNDKYAVAWAHAQWAPEDFKSDGDIAGIIASFKFE